MRTIQDVIEKFGIKFSKKFARANRLGHGTYHNVYRCRMSVNGKVLRFTFNDSVNNYCDDIVSPDHRMIESIFEDAIDYESSINFDEFLSNYPDISHKKARVMYETEKKYSEYFKDVFGDEYGKVRNIFLR